ADCALDGGFLLARSKVPQPHLVCNEPPLLHSDRTPGEGLAVRAEHHPADDARVVQGDYGLPGGRVPEPHFPSALAGPRHDPPAARRRPPAMTALLEASVMPSGLNATEVTAPRCPVSTARSGPAATSHRRTVLS